MNDPSLFDQPPEPKPEPKPEPEPEPELEARIHSDPTVTERMAQAKAQRGLGKQGQQVMLLLEAAGHQGLIHREVDDQMNWPAVRGSRVLHELHRCGRIVRTAIVREGCHVYEHPTYWRPEYGSIPPKKPKYV